MLNVREQPAVLDAIRKFAGSEPAAPELDTFLSTVLFADVVESKQKQSAMDDGRWEGRNEAAHAIVHNAL